VILALFVALLFVVSRIRSSSCGSPRVILDDEFPRHGLIRIDSVCRVLVDLRQSMR